MGPSMASELIAHFTTIKFWIDRHTDGDVLQAEGLAGQVAYIMPTYDCAIVRVSNFSWGDTFEFPRYYANVYREHDAVRQIAKFLVSR